MKESIVRNLTKTLAVVSLLAPSSGYSLGIGDIKLHSALNQNLDAEISILMSSGEKASEIKVNLAPPDKFDESGVPWTSLLSKIKFTPVVGSNGSVIIKLSSREAIKEPFLDFLLEVSWPKGSLYREFTVLLDPPAVYNQATLPVLMASEGFEAEQTAITQRQSKQKGQVSPDLSLSGVSEYGPIRRNDSLWKIAERASSRFEGVTVEQMMIAMYEENPHAFYKENVHALSTGKTLKIPEREVVLKFSRKQALTEFNRQTNVWKNRVATTPIDTSVSKIVKPDNQLTLVAPTEAEVSDKVIITSENEQVSAKNKADHDIASKTIDNEVVSEVPPVNAVLQDKVVVLEKQLAMMQQILALKDQQLATLQNQFQPKPVVQSEVVQTTAHGQTGTVNPVNQQNPVHSEAKPPISPVSEAGSPINTQYLWVGGVGAGILPLFGWLLWRKRKLDAQINNQSSIVTQAISKYSESKNYFSTSKENDSSNNVDFGDKGAFLNELTFGDLGTFAIDQGEIDPISEADVYLAYGRYQQAEELMRDILRDQPSRDDCKLKLLEIYYSNKNEHAFEGYANEIAKAGKKDDVEFWSKVTKMGCEICQNSKLFSSETDNLSSKESTILEKMNGNLVETYEIEKNELTDFKRSNLSLSSIVELFDNNNLTDIPQISDRMLNFDLISIEDEVTDKQQNNEGIDFDLNVLSTKTEELRETLESLVSETLDDRDNDEFELFDFDFDVNETGINEIDIITKNKTVNNYELTNSLNDKLSGLNSCFSSDSFDRKIFLEKPILGLNDEDFDQKEALEVIDLIDIDELETKLDLVKAYIDISDTDAAKDIACEVLEKGTAEQKKIAKAILNDLE